MSKGPTMPCNKCGSNPRLGALIRCRPCLREDTEIKLASLKVNQDRANARRQSDCAVTDN